MKKVLVIFLLATLLVFSGCSRMGSCPGKAGAGCASCAAAKEDKSCGCSKCKKSCGSSEKKSCGKSTEAKGECPYSKKSE